MKIFSFVCFVVVSLAPCRNLFGQGFINLDFESSNVDSSWPSGSGFLTGYANVPGWTAYDAWEAVNYSGGTRIAYNNETLDAAGASLEGVDYWRPAIHGNYSVFLQGGTIWSPYIQRTNGVSVGQTGQIPSTAQSITYWGAGGGLRVTFNGQVILFNVISSAPNYVVYGADISAYAGQTGELLFHAPWPHYGTLLDNIQFSSSPIPEPSALSLFSICMLLTWCWSRRSRL